MFARLSLFAIVTALSAALVTAQTSCQATDTVVSGDNCVAIAARFNVSDAALLAANPVLDANCDNLFVGQQLCIPFPPTGCSAQYTVLSGNTCTQIAAQFGTTFAALVAANPALNAQCSNLAVGEVLCIPEPQCSAEYTVKAGDVCLSIVDQFPPVTVAELLAANPEIDSNCDNLLIGEVLCIPFES